MQNLSIGNVINISVATPQTGISQYNTSNVAIFTREAAASTFGTLGYKIYLSPGQVGTDFGTSSNTYAMALSLFSQQPNILNNQGYLVVIPFLTAAQSQKVTLTFPGTPASGGFELTYNAQSTVSIPYNASAVDVEDALTASPLYLSGAIVTGSVVDGFTIDTGVVGIGYPITITSNTLVDSLNHTVSPVVTVIQPGSTAETLDQAILRTRGLVSYFGVMSAEVPSQIVMLAAASVIQANNMIGLFVSYTSADVAQGGMLDLLRSGGLTQSRGLFYGGTLTTALQFMAAYAGLGFSVNFNASLSTITMNLKTLVGIQPDPNITQTIQTQCVASGVDTYPSIDGVAKILCQGADDFFDNQYNLQWFAGALTVAYFNTLAQVSTKVAQTENGMGIIKSALRSVCVQANTNGFLAPGAWNNPTTFGSQIDFYNNISQYGYYIYSPAVSQQLPSVRATRAAVPISIAIKYAGAIQSGTCVIYVNP